MSVLSGKTTFFYDFLHFRNYFFFIGFSTHFPSKTHVIIFSVADNNTQSSMDRFSAHISRPFCDVDRLRSTRQLLRRTQIHLACSLAPHAILSTSNCLVSSPFAISLISIQLVLHKVPLRANVFSFSAFMIYLSTINLLITRRVVDSYSFNSHWHSCKGLFHSARALPVNGRAFGDLSFSLSLCNSRPQQTIHSKKNPCNLCSSLNTEPAN
jgi:hypothetical protein